MDNNQELNILILEDVAADAELSMHELKKANIAFKSQRVSDKDAFLKALGQAPPDVILSDYSLPQFNGLEAFMLLQQRNLNIPFLLVTGALPEATVVEIIKAGIDDYILKDNLQRLPSSLKNAYDKRKAQHRNDELNELRKKFVLIMSHQLRTPLTVVRWHLEHLLGGEAGAVKPEQEGILREAYGANQKLIERIDDLLTVMEIEEGRMHMEKQHVSLENLCKSVMVNVRRDCKAKGLVYKYQEPEDALYISGDAEKLRKTLHKLTENAISYTPAPGTVTVSLKHQANMARFEITDTGAGIPKTEQKDIFTPFYRASNASTLLPDASGVGLTIAKYFVEQHGGTIGSTSKEGQGSTFWFEIPLTH